AAVISRLAEMMAAMFLLQDFAAVRLRPSKNGAVSRQPEPASCQDGFPSGASVFHLHVRLRLRHMGRLEVTPERPHGTARNTRQGMKPMTHPHDNPTFDPFDTSDGDDTNIHDQICTTPWSLHF